MTISASENQNAAAQRLAVYGSLAPGKPNHAVIADIHGRWRSGWVEGDLYADGWGAQQGYPGMIWRPGAARIPVELLESESLPAHWKRLDSFEGSDYLRIVVPVFGVDDTRGGLLANIYELRRAPHGRAD